MQFLVCPNFFVRMQAPVPQPPKSTAVAASGTVRAQVIFVRADYCRQAHSRRTAEERPCTANDLHARSCAPEFLSFACKCLALGRQRQRRPPQAEWSGLKFFRYRFRSRADRIDALETFVNRVEARNSERRTDPTKQNFLHLSRTFKNSEIILIAKK